MDKPASSKVSPALDSRSIFKSKTVLEYASSPDCVTGLLLKIKWEVKAGEWYVQLDIDFCQFEVKNALNLFTVQV